MIALRRTIHPEIRVISEAESTAQFTASDETLDSFFEVIRADGWKFSKFARNSPVLDSHRMDSIGGVIGKVTDYEVRRGKLMETVKFATDVPENTLARLAFGMIRAGMLKACSVGFVPIKTVSRWDQDPTAYRAELKRLGLTEADNVRTVYIEQDQIELSMVCVGANDNALVSAKSAGILRSGDIDFLCRRRPELIRVFDPVRRRSYSFPSIPDIGPEIRCLKNLFRNRTH